MIAFTSKTSITMPPMRRHANFNHPSEFEWGTIIGLHEEDCVSENWQYHLICNE